MHHTVRRWERVVNREFFFDHLGISLADRRHLNSVFVFTMPAITLSFCKLLNDKDSEHWEMRFWSKRRFMRRLMLPVSEAPYLSDITFRDYGPNSTITLKFSQS